MSNSNSKTKEMIVDKLAKNNIKLIFDIKKVPAEYAPNLNLNLNVEKLRTLGWNPEIGLQEAYRRMIESFKEV